MFPYYLWQSIHTTSNNIKRNTNSLFIHLGSDKVAEVLINNGANVNAVDDVLWTPLHWVAQHGNFEAASESMNRVVLPNFQLCEYCWTKLAIIKICIFSVAQMKNIEPN